MEDLFDVRGQLLVPSSDSTLERELIDVIIIQLLNNKNWLRSNRMAPTRWIILESLHLLPAGPFHGSFGIPASRSVTSWKVNHQIFIDQYRGGDPFDWIVEINQVLNGVVFKPRERVKLQSIAMKSISHQLAQLTAGSTGHRCNSYSRCWKRSHSKLMEAMRQFPHFGETE